MAKKLKIPANASKTVTNKKKKRKKGKGQKNPIVPIVAVIVIALLAVLSIRLFACHDDGKEAPANETSVNSEASASSSTSVSASKADGDASLMTREELEEALSTSTAPVGDNARDAALSQTVPTVSNVYAELKRRGFEDFAVQADFAIDGTYTGTTSLEEGSSEKRPSYVSFYTSSSDVIWLVYVNDGCYMAVPMSLEGKPLDSYTPSRLRGM